MRTFLGVLFGALTFSTAHAAHDLRLERGYVYFGEDSIPWEVATARADVRGADRGRPGAVFVAVMTRSGKMMALTTAGWEPFTGGLVPPAAVFQSLPSSPSLVVFNSRDTDRRGRRLYDTGLPGRTLCEAAAMLGASDFTLAVGYGVLTQDDEATIDRMRSLGSKLDLDHMRLAFVHRNMRNHNKWSEVYRLDCGSSGLGLGEN